MSIAIFCSQSYGKLFIEIKILKTGKFWGRESLNCNISIQKCKFLPFQGSRILVNSYKIYIYSLKF